MKRALPEPAHKGAQVHPFHLSPHMIKLRYSVLLALILASPIEHVRADWAEV